MIKFENITYKNNNDDTLILENVSFSIEKNKYNLIIGKNGSGKTTIVKIIMGLIKPEGKIFINEEKLIYTEDFLYKLRKKIGVVFQNLEEQIIGETVIENLIFPMENNNLEKNEMGNNFEKYIKLFEIEHLLNRKISSLSGGEKQKIALASVFMVEPEILIIDEVMEMLDENNKKNVNKILENFLKNGKTIIAVNHNKGEIKEEYVIFQVENGKIKKLNNEEKIKYINENKFSQNNENSKKNENIVNKIKIKGENISYFYEKKNDKVLNKFSFEILENKINLIIGKSGIGKTTLVEIINGLIKLKGKFSGEIKININGKNYIINENTREKEFFELRKNMKIVFQNVETQFFESSVKKEFEYNIKKKYGNKIKIEEVENKINEIIKKLEINKNLLEKSPFLLSEGEKKLIGIGLMLVTNPEIIFLDEPTNFLDEQTTLKIMEILENISSKVTVVIVTHNENIIKKYRENQIILQKV